MSTEQLFCDSPRFYSGTQFHRIKRIALATIIGALLFTASRPLQAQAAYSDNGNTIILVGLDWHQFRTRVHDYAPEYRLKSFNCEFFQATKEYLFAGIFEKNVDQCEVKVEWGLSKLEFVAYMSTLDLEGWEMMQAGAYNTYHPHGSDDFVEAFWRVDEEPQYFFIAYQRPGPAWEVNFDIPPNIWGAISPPAGMKTAFRTFAGAEGLSTVLYKEDDRETMELGFPVSVAELGDLQYDLGQDGWQLTSLHARKHFGLMPIFKRTTEFANHSYIWSHRKTETVVKVHSNYDQLEPQCLVMFRNESYNPYEHEFESYTPLYFLNMLGEPKFKTGVLPDKPQISIEWEPAQDDAQVGIDSLSVESTSNESKSKQRLMK